MLSAGWWAERVGPWWPAACARPSLRPWSLEDLLVRRDAMDSLASCDAAVLICREESDLRSLLRIAAHLREQGRPGLAIVEAWASPWVQRLGAAGLIVLPAHSEPGVLAGMLCGLVANARSRRELEEQASTSDIVQARARSWLRRVDEELHMAAKMQREMIPRERPDPGVLDVGAIFRPLWHVSGDIYRFWPMGDERWAFMMAAARGHGVRAAMAVMIIAHELCLDHLPHDRTPSEALKRLNAAMCDHPSEALRFATAICGTIDLSTGTVDVAAAGHPHPLLVRHSHVRQIELDGPVLGVFPDAEFAQSTLTLEPEATLIVHTDGLEEAFGSVPANLGHDQHAEGNATDRARRALLRFSDASRRVQDQLDELSTELDDQYASLHRSDDVTVLGLRRSER
ncbi:MAG: PP2C family protein-serine/threonine phosphatase [Phycisphaerales bacterium]